MKSTHAKAPRRKGSESILLSAFAPWREILCLLLVTLFAAPSFAGLYYSGEEHAELPAQWRGFLVDQRNLRALAAKPAPGMPASHLFDDYRAALVRLENKAERSADESADLGALYIRLGQNEKAVGVLRPTQRQYPRHFRIAANLGTAWQLLGDLEQAEAMLRQAVPLAPEKLRAAEALHLKLVQQRRRASDPDARDDLFGVPFTGSNGKFEPGRIAEEQRKKLPANAVALVQQLALSLPADARLLWQLGELANAFGDIRTAAAIFEGCVTEFGLKSPELRERRQALRATVEKLPPAALRTPEGFEKHEQHKGIVFRSSRALVRRFDPASLPEPRDGRSTDLPWPALTTMQLDGKFPVHFPKYLARLDGKPVALTGFMQPIGNAQEASSFLLLEFPVGCWFCETPPPSGMMLVELAGGKAISLRRGLVKIEGVLKLNANDPEDFLLKLKDATVSEID